ASAAGAAWPRHPGSGELLSASFRELVELEGDLCEIKSNCVNTFLFSCPFPLAQEKFLDFASGRFRQRRNELNIRGALEHREILAAKMDQLARLDLSALFQHDKSLRSFSIFFMRRAHHCDFRHRWMQGQGLLDFLGRNIVAAYIDDVPRAVAQL